MQAVETEVANLKKSVSDGKTLVAGAITDKGITTATDVAFATMADNINQISTLAADTADATATAAKILVGAKAYVKGLPVMGTMPNNGGPSTAIAAGSLKAGYTSGGAIVNLVAENILADVNIGSVVGKLIPKKILTGKFVASGKKGEDTLRSKDISLAVKPQILICYGTYYNTSSATSGVAIGVAISSPVEYSMGSYSLGYELWPQITLTDTGFTIDTVSWTSGIEYSYYILYD